eukprot:TRINITY_DN2683_c0_g1_i2.p2 TRINITY_DN2683_c0_g1~~TRINITY_DN2683_c0_g1_i2.p2  ORF type:complete len:100 (+),score=16.37 TRINITY_DN2683_c0_g1_i2:56-355(+)
MKEDPPNKRYTLRYGRTVPVEPNVKSNPSLIDLAIKTGSVITTDEKMRRYVNGIMALSLSVFIILLSFYFEISSLVESLLLIVPLFGTFISFIQARNGM